MMVAGTFGSFFSMKLMFGHLASEMYVENTSSKGQNPSVEELDDNIADKFSKIKHSRI